MSHTHPLTQALLVVQGAVDDVEAFANRVVPAWRAQADKVATSARTHVRSKWTRVVRNMQDTLHHAGHLEALKHVSKLSSKWSRRTSPSPLPT